MSTRAADAVPPCYAMTLPGLETVAADEIAHDLGGTVRRTSEQVVVFRVPEIDSRLLAVRTTEDVYLLAWGTDQLTYRAEDLERIRRWTAQEADWQHLLRLHHAVRPRPKGKPTYRLVTQMTGTHGYRRIDAQAALAKGLAGKLPASWKPAEENAAVEIWLTIHETTAVCGVRLSDRTMRHRTYKHEHLPASLRPTMAAALVRLAETRLGHVVLDPMCGAGTILAELLALREVQWRRQQGEGVGQLLGGDVAAAPLRSAAANLRSLGRVHLQRWDARRLPLADEAVDRVVSNPPFGKQLSTPEEVGPLYGAALAEFDRVLRPGGVAVLLVADTAALRAAARAVGWRAVRQVPVRVLGQKAAALVWRKG
jgi:23S rRNA G2445 N2-methylase RlmL